MLAAVLRRLEDEPNPDKRAYAIEKASGARHFTIMTPDEAWSRSSGVNRPAHLYEVLSRACNMYLDIEWECTCAPGAGLEHTAVSLVVEKVKHALQQRYNETKPHVTRVTSSGLTCRNRYKCSWHVHIACQKVCWANAAAVGQFVKDVCAQDTIVDKVPYAHCGQNWRCVGSAKYSEPHRCFMPADHTTFMSCIIQQCPGQRQVVYPTVFATQSKAIVPVPEHVRRLAATLDETTEPVMCSGTLCVLPFRKLQYCEHVGRKHRSNHQYAVIDVCALVWRMKCHGCPEYSGCWQTFDDSALVQRAFEAQARRYVANAPAPMTLSAATSSATVLNLHAVGPPPPTSGTVQCRDGTYSKAI